MYFIIKLFSCSSHFTFILDFRLQNGAIRLLYQNIQPITALFPVAMTILRDHLKVCLDLYSGCGYPITHCEGQ